MRPENLPLINFTTQSYVIYLRFTEIANMNAIDKAEYTKDLGKYY